MIRHFVDKRTKKITLHQLQQMTGFLNFLCRCVVPGRAFLRRLYCMGDNEKLLPHHHIRISAECRLDMEIWQKFLEQPLIFCSPFIDCFEQTAEDIDMYSDASGSVNKGFEAYCSQQWICHVWDKLWMVEEQPSIEYLRTLCCDSKNYDLDNEFQEFRNTFAL